MTGGAIPQAADSSHPQLDPEWVDGVLLTGVVWPLFRRLTPVMVARRIEKHIPGIHNRLVSSLDLSASGAKPA